MPFLTVLLTSDLGFLIGMQYKSPFELFVVLYHSQRDERLQDFIVPMFFTRRHSNASW